MFVLHFVLPAVASEKLLAGMKPSWWTHWKSVYTRQTNNLARLEHRPETDRQTLCTCKMWCLLWYHPHHQQCLTLHCLKSWWANSNRGTTWSEDLLHYEMQHPVISPLQWEFVMAQETVTSQTLVAARNAFGNTSYQETNTQFYRCNSK